MSDITRIIPKPVPLTLGGRGFLASELRLDDVAALQAWVSSVIPSPYDAAEDGLMSGAGDRAWKRLLSETIDAQVSWPPEPGDPEAEEVLQSHAGRKVLLALVLRREHPELSAAEIVSLYPEIAEREYARLVRVAWGADPLSMLSHLVDGPSGGGGRGELDWGAVWFKYLTTAANGPAFHDLTISQYIAFRCEGSPSRGYVDASRPDWREVAARRQEFFAGLGAEEIPAPVTVAFAEPAKPAETSKPRKPREKKGGTS